MPVAKFSPGNMPVDPPRIICLFRYSVTTKIIEAQEININDLFLQILPVVLHFQYSSKYVKFAEMNE